MKTQLHKRIFLFTLLFALAATNALAALIAYEPFDYPAGNTYNGVTPTGTGWTGAWSGGAATVNSFGLTYPGLPTANLSLVNLGANGYVNHIASAPNTGSVWASFLLVQGSDAGGNRNGIILEDATGAGIMFSYQQYSGSQGKPCLMAMSGTTSVGSQIGTSANLQTYQNTNFYVLEFTYTSGVVSSISVYSNPTAGQGTPPSPDFTVSSGLPGFAALYNFGLYESGGPATIDTDEWRVGTTFGDVVGAVTTTPTIATTLALSVAEGQQVSWTANATDSYQPQSSSDGVNWNNLGGVLVGNAVTSVYNPSPAAYYQVLDYTVGGASTNLIVNGNFETPDPTQNSGALDWVSSQNDSYDSVWATNSYGSLTPYSGTSLLYMEGTTATNSPTAPDTYAYQNQIPVTPGVAYTVSFYAANPVQVGGANPQYFVQFFDEYGNFLSQTVPSFASAGGAWKQFTTTATAPASAAQMAVQFIQAVGAGPGWDWVTLVDDVSVTYLTTGPTNMIAATVQDGAIFTATIETNGVAATAATGSVLFETNTVSQSTGTVGGGVANSAVALLSGPYTVKAVYSGDGTYIGSTATLTVGGVSTTPTRIITSFSHGEMTLSWPADHTGWRLLVQTNLKNGVSSKPNDWGTVSNSSSTNSVTIPTANPYDFYRLTYP
jgi:hypothetical protein